MQDILKETISIITTAESRNATVGISDVMWITDAHESIGRIKCASARFDVKFLSIPAIILRILISLAIVRYAIIADVGYSIGLYDIPDSEA